MECVSDRCFHDRIRCCSELDRIWTGIQTLHFVNIWIVLPDFELGEARGQLVLGIIAVVMGIMAVSCWGSGRAFVRTRSQGRHVPGVAPGVPEHQAARGKKNSHEQ